MSTSQANKTRSCSVKGTSKRSAGDAELSDKEESPKKLPHTDSPESDNRLASRSDIQSKKGNDLSNPPIDNERSSGTLEDPAPGKECSSDVPDSSSPSPESPAAPDSPQQSVRIPRLPDTELANTYDKLPNLVSASLVPSDGVDTVGFFKFGLWRDLLSGGDEVMKKIKDAVTFTSKSIYFNPSRATPLSVHVGEVKTSSNFNAGVYVVSSRRKSSCMIALMTGCVLSCDIVRSHIYSYKDRSSISKRLTLLPHSHEFECYVAFLGTVFGFRSILAPCLSGSGLTFSTRVSDMASPQRKSATSLKLQSFLDCNLPSPSTSSAVAGLGHGKITRTSLGAYDNVPIYDATGVNFSLSQDIDDVAGLPLYESGQTDLPDGSCVTVGHTIGTYKNKEGKDTLSLNIHWVVVWGCPDS